MALMCYRVWQANACAERRTLDVNTLYGNQSGFKIFKCPGNAFGTSIFQYPKWITMDSHNTWFERRI